MPQFWSIGNGIWIGILALIPLVNVFMSFYLGFNGYQMAYDKSYLYEEE